MHLASDYIHPYKDAGGRHSHCRVRIYLPDDLDAPVVVCSELPNYPDGSITNSADHPTGMDRALARGDYRRKRDLRAGCFLQLRGRRKDTLPRGDAGTWIGDATWKPLDRASVEVLVGGKV
jgi:hypothetical protein